jgi:hypothetical protein
MIVLAEYRLLLQYSGAGLGGAVGGNHKHEAWISLKCMQYELVVCWALVAGLPHRREHHTWRWCAIFPVQPHGS